MKNNKKFEGKLHIPPMPTNKTFDLIQESFCSFSNGCVEDCNECLFELNNIEEFKSWFNEKFKTD
jgi:hypothetical protein